MVSCSTHLRRSALPCIYAKKMEVRCFSFMESTVTVRVTGAKKVQHDPPFFCAYDKPSLFFGLQKICRQIARSLRNPCRSAHFLRWICAKNALILLLACRQRNLPAFCLSWSCAAALPAHFSAR